VSEGYSEAVVRLLSDHWSMLDQFLMYAKKSRSFKAFVLRHIDATTEESDLNTIAHHAAAECPRHAHQLCLEIDVQVTAALKDARAGSQ